jgi:predicted nucleic acid-binding Zn ribbon protein
MTKAKSEKVHWVPGYLNYQSTACGRNMNAVIKYVISDVSKVTCPKCKEQPELKERLLKQILER